VAVSRSWQRADEIDRNLLPCLGDIVGVREPRGFALESFIREAVFAVAHEASDFSKHPRPVIQTRDPGDRFGHAEVAGRRVGVQTPY